jgi:hypothetical protein
LDLHENQDRYSTRGETIFHKDWWRWVVLPAIQDGCVPDSNYLVALSTIHELIGTLFDLLLNIVG